MIIIALLAVGKRDYNVLHFGPEQKSQITIKLGVTIHGRQSINLNDSVNPLSFSIAPPSGQTW